MAGYGMSGYGGGTGYGGGGAAWGIRWMYALLILIVIVLQFGRRAPFPGYGAIGTGCCSETAAAKDETAVAALPGFGFFGNGYGFESIDRSVLFIIVVFLLILCGGCFWGGGAGGYGGYGGGGCGMY